MRESMRPNLHTFYTQSRGLDALVFHTVCSVNNPRQDSSTPDTFFIQRMVQRVFPRCTRLPRFSFDCLDRIFVGTSNVANLDGGREHDGVARSVCPGFCGGGTLGQLTGSTPRRLISGTPRGPTCHAGRFTAISPAHPSHPASIATVGLVIDCPCWCECRAWRSRYRVRQTREDGLYALRGSHVGQPAAHNLDAS